MKAAAFFALLCVPPINVLIAKHSRSGDTLHAHVCYTKQRVQLTSCGSAGEHMDAFEEFDTKSFVARLLGKGDVKGLAKKLEEAMPEEKQMEFMEQLQKGTMTLRFFRGFLEQVGSMGPLSSVPLLQFF